MKTKLLTFFLLLCCYGCHQKKIKQAGADNVLIGEWGIYETVSFQGNDDGTSIVCNVCPKIFFLPDETGYIRRPDQQKFNFKWDLDSTILIITHVGGNKDSDDVIGDGIYQFIKADKKVYQEISIIDTSRNIKYILRK